MSDQVRLGDWTTRRGNNVVAFYVRGAVYPAPALVLAWDRTPPLSPADQADYDHVILPAIIKATAAYLEILGPALVVGP